MTLREHLDVQCQKILSIGNFDNFKRLPQDRVLYIPVGTEKIRVGEYENLEGYDKVVFPPSIKYISKKAFFNCSAKFFDFNEGLEVIEELAFATDKAKYSKVLPDLPSSLTVIYNNSFGLVSSELPSGILPDFIWPLEGLRFEGLKEINIQKQSGYLVSSDIASLIAVGVFNARLSLEERVRRFIELFILSSVVRCKSQDIEGHKFIIQKESIRNLTPIELVLNYLNIGFLPAVLDMACLLEATKSKGLFERLELELYTLLHQDDYFGRYFIRRDDFQASSHRVLFSTPENRHNLMLGLGMQTDELSYSQKQEILELLFQLDFGSIQDERVTTTGVEEVPSVIKVLDELKRLGKGDFLEWLSPDQGHALQSFAFEFIVGGKGIKSMKALKEVLDEFVQFPQKYIDIIPKLVVEPIFFELGLIAKLDLKYLKKFLDSYYEVLQDSRSFRIIKRLGVIPDWGVDKYILLDKVSKVKFMVPHLLSDGVFDLKKAVEFINTRDLLSKYFNFIIGLGELVNTEQEMWSVFANKYKDILPNKVYESFIQGDAVIVDIIRPEVDKTLSAIKLAWACGVWYYRNNKYNLKAIEHFKKLVEVRNMENLFSGISMGDTSPDISKVFLDVCARNLSVASKAFNFYRIVRKKYKREIDKGVDFSEYLIDFIIKEKHYFKYRELEEEFKKVGYFPEQSIITWSEAVYEVACGIFESCDGDYSKIKDFVQTVDNLEGDVVYCWGRIEDVRMYSLKETCDTCAPIALHECSLLHSECQTLLFICGDKVIGKISGHIDLARGEILFNTFELKGNASISDELAASVWGAFKRAMYQQQVEQEDRGFTINTIAVAGVNNDIQKLLEMLIGDQVRRCSALVEPYTYVSYLDATKTYVGDVSVFQFVLDIPIKNLGGSYEKI